MSNLFEVRRVDRDYYENRIKDFLPESIVDIHTHVWLEEFREQRGDAELYTAGWPARVARDNSMEDLFETYRLIFPGKKVTPLIFGSPVDYDIEKSNRYVTECSCRHKIPSLILAVPEWSGDELKQRILSGGFLGVKVYLSLSPSYIPIEEIRIFDFLPHHQLEVLNSMGCIVILHIPRSGRLNDPVNLAQMVEIDRKYPDIKTVIAHVGRAYCIENAGNAFDVLKKTDNLLFDISANTNSSVFKELIEAAGPGRILFGSDFPILRMRARRICEDGTYVNIVPKGLYGDVSGDFHMREAEGREADRLTFFMYEEIDAFRRAAEAAGLAPKDIEDVFYLNGFNIIEQTRSSLY